MRIPPLLPGPTAKPHCMQVIYEDNHLCVVSKPAGLATMGALPGISTALELVKTDIARRYNKPGAVYLGVVSRLDSAVSGVLVFARTSKAAARLSAQFRDRTAKKTYVAITSRPPQKQADQLECWMKRNDQRQITVPARPQEENAQKCSLDYQVLGQGSGHCLLQITPHTGRKHQIRAQLKQIGSPILGDHKYNSDCSFPEGIALHALSLQLQHPVLQELFTFSTSPPASWPTWAQLLLKQQFSAAPVTRQPLQD